MTAFSTMKFLLVGSLLYVCFSSGDASFARVTSVATSVVEQTLPSHVYASIVGHGRNVARVKRQVTTKKLDDPKSCVSECRDNQTSQMVKATLRNVGRLVALALTDIDGDEVSSPEKQAAFERRVEAQTIANMGPYFDDLCKITKRAGECISKCSDTKLRSIMTIDNKGNEEALCEPGKNWSNFTEYWTALNCTNSTEIEKPCENKCGREQKIRNVTNLDILGGDVDFEVEDDGASGGISLQYETDSKKNTAAVGPVCKLVSCQIDCYKPIMTEKCGAKAYDLYSRTSKLEPRTSLSILKTLNAVEATSDCKAYQ